MATESHSRTEEWRPVVGWEGLYEVSSLGRLRGRTGRILKGKRRASDGYMVFRLRPAAAKVEHAIHQLVAQAFLGTAPYPNQEPRHLGDQSDNSAANLEWGPRTSQVGSRNSNAQLTEESVRYVKALHGLVPQSVVAEAVGASVAAVGSAGIGRSWGHVVAAPRDEAFAWLKRKTATPHHR